MGNECHQAIERMKMLYQNKMPIAIKEIGSVAAGVRVQKRKIHAKEDYFTKGLSDLVEDVKELITGDSEKLEVHSIVGMVGLGKTTLARKVYQDDMIVFQFFARAFVNVTQVCDVKEVFLKILGHFVDITDEIIDMHVDSIRDKVYNELTGKKYLIVLDDIWKESDWDDLKEAFPTNQNHSRILITTRHMGICRDANSSMEPYPLRFMSPMESKDLLRWKLFGHIGCPSELEQQINNYESLILDKCGGLPLAIMVVAGILLDYKHRVDWWRNVCARLKSSEHIKSDMIGLCFGNLPYYLKSCFLYLGVFPEYFDIPVWKLLRLWIAEGLIQGKGNLEDVAERYLGAMIDRSLVIVSEKEWNGQIKKCRVNDFVREFCKTEAMKRNLTQEMKGSSPTNKEMSVDGYQRIVINSEILNYVLSKPSGQRLRSFLSFPKEEVTLPAQLVQVIPKAFKMLRVFDARSVNFKRFPVELLYLILLKYIAMSCDDIDTISVKLSNLWNLQTFIFETTSPTLTIKADIWQMEQLRHLKISNPFTLPPVSAESIKSKSKLQTLSTIAPESCTREVFDKCKDLKKLRIRGKLAQFVDPTSGPGLYDNLSRLDSLENLKLLNSDVNGPLPRLPHHENFPFMLNRLTLSGTSLRWEHMSTLGRLKNLMVLKLKDNAFTGDFWRVREGGFASLSVLYIEKADLVAWVASWYHFPVLTTLILKYCKELTGIPHDFGMIDSFQRIELRWTNPKVVLSAKDIQVEKLQNIAPFILGVYPPES